MSALHGSRPHRAAVVGARGYTGQEAVRLLSGHADFDLVGVFGSDAESGEAPLWTSAPSLRGVVDLPVESCSVEALVDRALDVVFLATPHEASLEMVPLLLAGSAGLRVIDLSGAFRLRDPAAFSSAYGLPPAGSGVMSHAVYGLPEVDRTGLHGARLVACAGCYVTAASIPLAALANAGVLAQTPPIIDATSGVSGAGRGAKLATSYCEVSMHAYGVGKHRHRPEIEQAVGRRVRFQPHLGTFDRGILATIHADLAPGIGPDEIARALDESFVAEPFVRVIGQVEAGGRSPSVAGVAHTNFIDIAWSLDGSHLTVFSALDNLLKGASGQAVQCANAAFGYPETAGLLPGAGDGAFAGAGVAS